MKKAENVVIKLFLLQTDDVELFIVDKQFGVIGLTYTVVVNVVLWVVVVMDVEVVVVAVVDAAVKVVNTVVVDEVVAPFTVVVLGETPYGNTGLNVVQMILVPTVPPGGEVCVDDCVVVEKLTIVNRQKFGSFMAIDSALQNSKPHPAP